MKAMLLETAGAAFRLADVPRPESGAGQVLVRIRASGVNPLDTKIRAGQAAHARHPLPAILVLDLAGVVEQFGSAVTDFRSGYEVYGMTGGVGSVIRRNGGIRSVRNMRVRWACGASSRAPSRGVGTAQ